MTSLLHLLLLLVAITVPGVLALPLFDSAFKACTSLVFEVPSISLYTPSTTAFNVINTQTIPTCIVRPRTTSQVSSILSTIFRYSSPYAVQAGGHSGMAGWDTTSGVLILLSSLNDEISYNPKDATVTFGPGKKWGEIYNATAPHGISVLGGRQGVVGTGLLLGGGLSFLSPQYGYASDQLVEVEVVTVNGRVVKASQTVNRDLFRAVKGGGGRFGVVTKWKTRAIKTGTEQDKRWYGGSLYFTESSIPSVLAAMDALVARPDDPRASVLASFGVMRQPTAVWSGSVQLYYQGTQGDFETYYANLLAIPAAVSSLTPLSYLDMSRQTPIGYDGKRAYKWWGQMTRPDNKGTRFIEMWEEYRAFLVENAQYLELGYMSISPIKTIQTSHSHFTGGGSVISPPLGVNFASVQHSDYLFSNYTSFPSSLDAARTKLGQKWSSLVDDAGLPLFLNEADKSQNAFATYGAYDELKQTYAKWDPTRFSVRFQEGPIGL
ncbi:hypothetical protein ACQY0O_005135 [Thecaphora frezii]